MLIIRVQIRFYGRNDVRYSGNCLNLISFAPDSFSTDFKMMKNGKDSSGILRAIDRGTLYVPSLSVELFCGH